MRQAVTGAPTLKQQLDRSLAELCSERELIRRRVEELGLSSHRWAELEREALIAELVGRKATPAARRTVDRTLAAVRAFGRTLLH